MPFVSSFIALFALSALAASPNDVVPLGSTNVHLVQTTGVSGPSYFHPHENEHTSADVTRAFVKQEGGSLLEIQCQGQRRITFALNDRTYSFDPNRMFTDAGLEATMSTHDHAALDAVRLLRDSIIAKLKLSGGPVVAVHNNENLDINFYRPGGRLARDAREISIHMPGTPYEFFLVLDEKLFRGLDQAGFNVVLQSLTPTDDGSFSIYCLNTGLRYMDVEAGRGRAAEQRRMLAALLLLLKRG